MSEFEFLDKMFYRLKEARYYESKSKDAKQKATNEAWRLSIECSIKDFLKFRGSND